MSNNAPDYENDLVFAPSMPRCDIDELKAKLEQSEKMRDLQAEYACKLEKKLKIAEEALEFIIKTIPADKWIGEKDLESCYRKAEQALAKIKE